MYCSYCGSPLVNDPQAKFCPQCGAEITLSVFQQEEKLNKGMVVASAIMVGLLFVNILLRYTVMRQGVTQIRIAYGFLGLLSSCYPFVLAYYSTMQKYRNLLLILGCVQVTWAIISWFMY